MQKHKECDVIYLLMPGFVFLQKSKACVMIRVIQHDMSCPKSILCASVEVRKSDLLRKEAHMVTDLLTIDLRHNKYFDFNWFFILYLYFQ